MYLQRLIYYSHNAIKALNKPATGEIKTILAASKRNNPAAGITGALLFNGTYFAQVLEGDRKAITETFCRISSDPRHCDIVIMEAKPITERLFSDWSLGFAGHSDVMDNLYVKFGPTVGFNPAKMSADGLLGLVVDVHRHTDLITSVGSPQAAAGADNAKAV